MKVEAEKEKFHALAKSAHSVIDDLHLEENVDIIRPFKIESNHRSTNETPTSILTMSIWTYSSPAAWLYSDGLWERPFGWRMEP